MRIIKMVKLITVSHNSFTHKTRECGSYNLIYSLNYSTLLASRTNCVEWTVLYNQNTPNKAPSLYIDQCAFKRGGGALKRTTRTSKGAIINKVSTLLPHSPQFHAIFWYNSCGTGDRKPKPIPYAMRIMVYYIKSTTAAGDAWKNGWT